MKIQIGDTAYLMRAFKVFRILKDGRLDVCDVDGNCLLVNQSELLTTNKNQATMKAMKDAVLTVAKGLLKANNTVTTLEVKTELRRDYPYYYWTQDIVSKYMSQLAGDGIFDFKDNGTYRIYSFPVTKATKTVVASKSKPFTKKVKNLPASGSKTINKTTALNMVQANGVDKVIFKTGRTVTGSDIRSQKKSALAYVSRSLANISAVVVRGTKYNVN